MRLTFPNGEHAAVKVEHGQIGVGSAVGGGTSVTLPGLAPLHAVFAHGRRGSWLTVPVGQRVVVNARPVKRLAYLRPGDLVCLGAVQLRIEAEQPPPAPTGVEVRRALPVEPSPAALAVLRGLNGRWFGRCVALQSGRWIGRGAAADVRVDDQAGVLERHALLEFDEGRPAIRVAAPGALIRVNGHVVAAAKLGPGDQIEIGEQRFVIEGHWGSPPQATNPVSGFVPAIERQPPPPSPEVLSPRDPGGIYMLIAAAAALAAALTAFLVYAPRG